jgi:N-formylglutamate amidohydrolase
VRSQEDRDEQTVAIGSALGMFGILILAEVLGLWLLDATFESADQHIDALFRGAIVLAGTLAIANLARSRQR